MFLSDQIFGKIIENTPLVSIDLIVKNTDDKILLGKRLNRPAKGFWFVPGGRILKDETIEVAFLRLTKEELGQEFSMQQVKLLGAYNHFYDDNVFDDKFSTHYVALGYTLHLTAELDALPLNVQHQNYAWFDIENLKADPFVHQHTKWYFDRI